MKYTHLKELPLKERGKMVPPDWNKKYFQGVNLVKLCIFLIPLVINNLISLGYTNSGILPKVLCNTIGIVTALLAHLAISSGFVSCNTGSYFRTTEPIKFWINVLLLIASYMFTQVAIWYY